MSNYDAKLYPDDLSISGTYDLGGLTSNTASITSLTAITMNSSRSTFTGDYLNPLIIGSLRLWNDSTNDVLRVKYGSNPANETDGNIIEEGNI